MEATSHAIPDGNVDPYARPFFQRLRFKALCVFAAQIVGILAPVLLGLVRSEAVFSASIAHGLASNATNSLLWGMVAGLLSLVTLQQLVRYPGSWDIAFAFPSLLLGYGCVIAAMFVFRIEYSRYVILSGFFASIIWLHLDLLMRSRLFKQKIAVVPGGELRGLTELQHINWRTLTGTGDSLVGVQGVVADLHHDFSPDWERFMTNAVLAGLPVYDAKHMSEMQRGEVEFEHLSENTFGTVLPSKLYLRVKRIGDAILALLISPLVLIVVTVFAVMVKLESSGPILYRQTRCGYRGKPFTLYKLRSMVQGADRGSLFTTQGDSRITRVGALIRKYRIDELPQILNILKGEMSWVGPRPEAIELAKWYAAEIPYYMYRHAVPPGITGWAQVQQGNVAEIEAANRKLKYDFFYIKYFSLWLDVLIFLKTIRTILTGFGSR